MSAVFSKPRNREPRFQLPTHFIAESRETYVSRLSLPFMLINSFREPFNRSQAKRESNLSKYATTRPRTRPSCAHFISYSDSTVHVLVQNLTCLLYFSSLLFVVVRSSGPFCTSSSMVFLRLSSSSSIVRLFVLLSSFTFTT